MLTIPVTNNKMYIFTDTIENLNLEIFPAIEAFIDKNVVVKLSDAIQAIYGPGAETLALLELGAGGSLAQYLEDYFNYEGLADMLEWFNYQLHKNVTVEDMLSALGLAYGSDPDGVYLTPLNV